MAKIVPSPLNALTSTRRAEIRDSLVFAGFVRGTATHDAGDGAYTEIWHLGANIVTLAWGSRADG